MPGGSCTIASRASPSRKACQFCPLRRQLLLQRRNLTPKNSGALVGVMVPAEAVAPDAELAWTVDGFGTVPVGWGRAKRHAKRVHLKKLLTRMRTA